MAPRVGSYSDLSFTHRTPDAYFYMLDADFHKRTPDGHSIRSRGWDTDPIQIISRAGGQLALKTFTDISDDFINVYYVVTNLTEMGTHTIISVFRSPIPPPVS